MANTSAQHASSQTACWRRHPCGHDRAFLLGVVLVQRRGVFGAHGHLCVLGLETGADHRLFYVDEIIGLGQHIDMSLLDCATAMLANQAMNYLATGESPMRKGNDHPNIAPYQVLPTGDGHVILAVGNDRQFQRLCQVIDRPTLAENPNYATNRLRVTNRAALTLELERALSSWTSRNLLEALEAATVPAGPINDLAQVFDDPQVKARGMRQDFDGVPGVRAPFRFSDAAPALHRPAPKLNEDG